DLGSTEIDAVDLIRANAACDKLPFAVVSVKAPRPAGFDDRHRERERIFADQDGRAILVPSDMDGHLPLRPVGEYLASVLILYGVARHNEVPCIRAEQPDQSGCVVG